jgi:hypothetical protein
VFVADVQQKCGAMKYCSYSCALLLSGEAEGKTANAPENVLWGKEELREYSGMCLPPG